MGDRESSASTPLFTFLIPAYRTEPWISETLDSLIAQTRPDWEAVVVDNGNVDAMAAIVAPYTDDPRIRLIRQENSGYGGGINAAADAAHGRWFVPLCSDDLVVENYCEDMAKAIESSPEVDVLSPDAEMFEDGTLRLFAQTFVQNSGVARRNVPTGDLTLPDIMEQQFLYYGGAFRREAWRGVGGHDSDTPRVEDLDLWLRLVAGGWSVRAIPDVLGRYRVRADSMSHAPGSVDVFEDEAVHAFTRAARSSGRPEDLAALDVAVRRLRYVSSIRRARWAFLDGDIPAARQAARAALAQRRTPRAAAIALGLALAPGVLRRLRPWKQEITRRVLDVIAARKWGRSHL
ncbi:hypothetical protein Acsp06_47020 [Actinomycetospora sp. NBRC 106375]|nr:hypothetical protein Acsp06_47020 [Actinomycetospora sp. NBRC 106375]